MTKPPPKPAALLTRLKKHLDCPTWTALSWEVGVGEAQISRWRRGAKMSRLWREKIEALLSRKGA